MRQFWSTEQEPLHLGRVCRVAREGLWFQMHIILRMHVNIMNFNIIRIIIRKDAHPFDPLIYNSLPCFLIFSWHIC